MELTTQQFESKNTSELTVVQTLLKALHKEELVLNLNALHCKKTTWVIVESGNEYVVTVKGNQQRLLAQLETKVKHQKPWRAFC